MKIAEPRRIMSFFGLLFVCILATFAQSPIQTSSKSINDQVDALFAQWDKPDSPGCALAVIKDGEIIYKRGYGMADLNRKIPISPTMVFNIGSTSKQFTAACIAMLAQQGKLSLDDNIRKYLPELPDFGSPITIRHLIHHTSGLRDIHALWELMDRSEKDLSPDVILKFIARQKELSFKPNDQYLYSNTGYYLMAMIIKRVSGLSQREYAEQNLFLPLGMIHTLFRDNPAVVPKNGSYGYQVNSNKFHVDKTDPASVGAYGVWTTIEDLLLWDRNLYSGKVGGAGFLEQMLTRGVLNSGEKIDYAFGLEVSNYRGLRRVEHSGGGFGFRSDYLRFPDQNFSVICLCNVNNVVPWNLTLKVADLYLVDQFKERQIETAASSATLPIQELNSKIGIYRNEQTGTVFKVIVKDGKLKIIIPGLGLLELLSIDHNRFKTAEEPFQFTFGRYEEDKSKLLKFTNEDQHTYDMVALKTDRLTMNQLAEYVGTYFSEECEVSLNIELKRDRLFLKLKSISSPLLPLSEDSFLVEKFARTITFDRDSRQSIKAAKLDISRALRIRFVNTR